MAYAWQFPILYTVAANTRCVLSVIWRSPVRREGQKVSPNINVLPACCQTASAMRLIGMAGSMSGRPHQHTDPDPAGPPALIDGRNRVKSRLRRLPDWRTGIIDLAGLSVDIPRNAPLPASSQYKGPGRLAINTAGPQFRARGWKQDFGRRFRRKVM